MEFVVDFQCFRDDKKNYILKEIAVLALCCNAIDYMLVKPPYAFESLPDKTQNQVRWLTRCHHGLRWTDGYVKHKDAVERLTRLVQGAKLIFVKGKEKQRYLQTLTDRKVIDLEDCHCPSLTILPSNDTALRCVHKAHYNTKTRLVCALTNASKLKAWIREIKGDNDNGFDVVG